jgi:anti-sigma B factor antagonist
MDSKNLVKIQSEGQTAVAALKSASITDADQIEQIHLQINSFVEEEKPKKLIIDFQNVKFFSSQMLGVLVELRTKLQNYNARVLISAINPQLYRIFRITNLDKLFRFFQNTEQAAKDDS